MIIPLAESFIQKFNSDESFSNSLSGGLFFQQAEQENEMPYGVFTFLSIETEDWLGIGTDKTKRMSEASVQFNLFTDASEGGYEIGSLIDLTTNCFDDCTLNLDGYYNVRMQRDVIGPVLFIDEIWQVNIDYAVFFVKE